MTKKEFIAKYEGWFSYTRREELKKEMETDLEEMFTALRQPTVIRSANWYWLLMIIPISVLTDVRSSRSDEQHLRCNTSLGFVNDDIELLEKMVNYLKEYKQ